MDIAVSMANALDGHDLAHSHTWYANLAYHLAKMTYGIPHVVTAHSLEPLRPWKAEQLGGGYRVSSWIEREAYESADAIVAVSGGMRQDVLSAYPAVPPERVHVIHNGIDTTLYRPDPGTDVLVKHGVDPDRPYVLFVGRITRQKGVPHLVRAGAALDPDTQLVLCAGGADTPELDAEFRGLVADLEKTRTGVRWIPDMLPRPEVVQLLTHAAVFACPSVYEPLGIVNLEAAACGTAVVASDVGGIPEVVDDGRTGLLVHYDEADTAGYEARLGAALNELVGDPDRAAAMGTMRPRARGRRVRLEGDRRADGRPLRSVREVLVNSGADVLGIVLAGGEGKRLMPLTADRAKPAVPFGGVHRLVDFVLSNLVHGGIRRLCVLTQYKSHSLDRHISTTWRLSALTGEYVTPVLHAAAAGPALVPGQRRRHPPEPQPGLRRGPRVHRGVRRGQHLPDGPPADAGDPHLLGHAASRSPGSGCRAPRRARSASSAPPTA